MPMRWLKAICAGVLIAGLLPPAVLAEPVALKLSFFAPDHIETYRGGVKPFVDGIDREGKELLRITLYPNGALGSLAEQPQALVEGRADIAFLVPGQTPYRFPDNALLEMPGMFRSAREGTLAYTRLLAAGALRGYEDFFVIGAYTTDPAIIHTRTPVGSLDALKGQKIRTNNPSEAESIERLGGIATIMPVTMLADALAKGSVDGAIMAPTAAFQFGAADVARNHYLLDIGSAPLILVMSRKKFDSLPEPAKALIRKYSGERAAAAWVGVLEASDRRILQKMRSDPTRTVVEPSPADREAAQHVFRSIVDSWVSKGVHNRELLERLEMELAMIRAAK